MSASKAYPNLMQILAAYFHQDWKYESKTAEAALLAGIADASPDSRRLALAELGDLIECPKAPDVVNEILWWETNEDTQPFQLDGCHEMEEKVRGRFARQTSGRVQKSWAKNSLKRSSA